MLYFKNKYPDDIRVANRKVLYIMQGNVLVYPISYTTEIEFTVTTTAVNQEVPIVFMRTLSGFSFASIDFGDGNTQIINVPVFEGTSSYVDNEGNTRYVDNSGNFNHTFQAVGEYRIIIQTTQDVYNIRFCKELIDTSEGTFTGATNPYITKFHKFKSTTLVNGDYTFSGLSKCVLDAGFVIEAPELTSIVAMFKKFGTDSSLPKWIVDSVLFSQISKPNTLSNLFAGSGIKKISAGIFDTFELVTSVFECFKNSSLGNQHYSGMVSNTYNLHAVNGTDDIIPVSLFWNMPILKEFSHCFNFIASGNFGNFTSGYSAMMIIRRELFWNGKSKGNVAGTITSAMYAFGKSNRILVEPNLLKHSPDMESIGGIFTQTISVSHATGWASSVPIGASDTTIWSFTEVDGVFSKTEVAGKGLSLDLQVIFPNVYPKIRCITGAFSNIVLNLTSGFNRELDYTPNGTQAKTTQELNVDAFLAKFPNATIGSMSPRDLSILAQTGTTIEKNDGRHGALYQLNDSRLVNNNAPSLVFNNAIPY